ncbi:GNAT family acetyltransferase [Streptomyces himastatinicus ATCC 53653]|uniref:GNAT family acetyltransferase n=2 Tax=Streptomyces violaceusniger group TaxID=2839105 RepID=D9WE74_9ACTN|nr:GNAT family acetyltransferase [Streptomyces himastatinicus ATCC 53653]
MARRRPGVKNRRMQEVKLSDGIVTLSPLHPDDAEAHLAGEDEALVRWLSGGPSTPQGVATYFRHCREQWDTAGPLRAFGIHANAEAALAGTIDLRFTAEGLAPGQVNIAYGLYPSWRGRGLATRAVLLASQYAAHEGGKEAVIRVEPENTASAAVARRAGFTPRGHTRGGDGTRLDWYVRDLRVHPSEGSHWLRRHTARWHRFARVTVRVVPAAAGATTVEIGDDPYAWLRTSYGPDALPYANDGGLRQEALDGVRYAVERLAEPGPPLHVTITEIRDYLVDTGPGDVKYAAAYALWDALGVEPPVRPYLADADGTPVFPD